MTTDSATIRRQREEAYSLIKAKQKVWEQELRDFSDKLDDLRNRCPHEHVNNDVSQVGVLCTCVDCGRVLGM